MNQVALRPISILPAAMAPVMDRDFRVMSNKLEPDGIGFSIAVEEAPTEDQRAALVRRVDRIDGCLLPLPEADIIAELGRMFEVLKARARTDAEGDLAIDVYLEACRDLPAFAFKAACHDYVAGPAGRDGWMPEPPVLREHAMAKVRPWKAERAQIDKLLKARIRAPRTSAENRKAVIDLCVAKYRSGLVRDGVAPLSEEAKHRQKERDEATAFIAHCLEHGVPDPRPMPKLDPRILAQFPIKQGVSS